MSEDLTSSSSENALRPSDEAHWVRYLKYIKNTGSFHPEAAETFLQYGLHLGKFDKRFDFYLFIKQWNTVSLAHDLRVSLLDKNGKAVPYEKVKNDCDAALARLHEKYPIDMRICPKCGLKGGLGVLLGLPGEEGKALLRLGYMATASCVRRTNFKCTCCSHYWTSEQEANVSQIWPYILERYSFYKE